MNHFRLIADSGSTKTDWAVGQAFLKTQGINPFHQDDEAILAILRDELLPQVEEHVKDLSLLTSIRFYGSGVRPELESRMEQLLQRVFSSATDVEARSDMLGAARALCGSHEGLACILGTGANSCLYDGRQIVANTPALGYVLGDEGSGAVLGKLFLNALYKNRLYAGAQEDFEQHTGLSMADVIARVYRQPMANRFLASLSTYICRLVHHAEVHNLVVENFRQFIRYNIAPYRRPDLPLSAVGSIAWHYQALLAEAAEAEGYQLGRILKSPIDGLVQAEGFA